MIGTTISHYKILEKLGGGGMGVVYKAQDARLDRLVALKFLPPDLTRDTEARQRFIHEAKAASALQHPNICTIHDIDETSDGQLFIVMDCYDGETLKDRIAEGQLPIDDCVNICTQVAQGMAKAHECGIIHRDIKPANIMIGKDGIARIVDFGLAKLSSQTVVTKRGSTLGTAAYMSPEQAGGEQVDQRTDIWSLGVVLYEMTTGKKPFDSEYEQALVYSIINQVPKAMREIRPDVPEAIEQMCRRAMAKDAKDRYQTAAELITDLGSYKSGTRLSQKTRKIVSKKRRLLLAGLGLFLALAVVAGYLLSPDHAEAIDTVAVLPFVNVSGNQDIEYLCDGLTEAVLEDLCRVSGLQKVIAFNSVMQYKNKEIAPGQVASKLGVAGLIISRLYRHGDDVTVSVELIRGKDEGRIWGSQYSRSLSQLSSIHNEISLAITENLHLPQRPEMTPRGTRRYTKNPEAYRLYLLGEYYFHRITNDGLRKAIELYRKALLLDPNFALAHAGIANGYAMLIDLNYAAWDQAVDSLRLEAANALAIDKNLAEGHLAVALLRYKSYEPEESEREFREAIELNPLCANAIHWYGHFLSDHGRHDEGIRSMKQSVELEPLSAHYQLCLGLLYSQARRYDEALAENEKIKDIDSTFYMWEYAAAMIYFYAGSHDKAVEYAKRYASHVPSHKMFLDYVGILVDAAEGNTRTAQRQLRRMCEVREGPRIDPVFVATAYSRLGNKDSALVWLEKGYREHSSLFFLANTLPDFDPLRADSRFIQLMRRAGYTN
jgi:serine/threonine-protein kinase